MPLPGPIRLVIASSEVKVRSRLASLAKGLPFPIVIATVPGGREAVKSHLKRHVDVILLDLRLPFAEGLSTIQAVRDRVPAPRIILLTSSSKDLSMKRALRAGADGLLSQAPTPQELAHCLRPLLGGKIPSPSRSETRRTIVLTKRELEILHLVGSRMKNKDIGETLSIAEGTVKIHVHTILAKLGANSRREAILKARNYGLMATL